MLYFSNFFEESKTVSGFIYFYSYVFSDKSDWERFQNNSAFFTSSLSKLRAMPAPGVLFTFVIRKEDDQTYVPLIFKGHDNTVPLVRGDVKACVEDACNDCLRMFADFISLHKVNEHGVVTFEPKKFPSLY